jgi:type II secretory pathway pseudopilin PulG
MSDSAIKFRLHHLFIVMTLAAVLLGGASWFLDSQTKARRRAAQAAAQRAEIESLLREITTRARLARAAWFKNPQRAWDNLNGMISGDTTDLSVYQVPLNEMITRLQNLHYSFGGVNLARLETLAERHDADALPELLLLVDQACPP